MSGSQLESVCRDNQAIIDQAFGAEFDCTNQARGQASSASECEQLRSECIDQEAMFASGDRCAEAGDTPDLADCAGLTIAQLLACIEDFAGLARTTTCTSAEPTMPSSCELVEDECPQIFGGSDSGGGSGVGVADLGSSP